MSTTMADEQTAETLANETTEVPATPVNDGIIDLDAQEEVKDEGDESKDGEADKAGDKPDEEDKPKKLSGAQRAKAREARLLNELAETNRRLEEATRSKPAQDAGDEAKPPREEDYNGDWFAWQRALTAFDAGKEARKAIREEFQTKETSERETKQAEIARERKDAHLERVEDAREVIADFDQVMEGMKGVNVRDELIDEIMASSNSAVIAYHLAQNKDKLDALNSLSGRELAREMGRLEATVKLPEAKRATTAPAPFSRSKGGAAPSSMEAELEGYLNKKYGPSRR
jgi:hypothetical protein